MSLTEAVWVEIRLLESILETCLFDLDTWSHFQRLCGSKSGCFSLVLKFVFGQQGKYRGVEIKLSRILVIFAPLTVLSPWRRDLDRLLTLVTS